MRLTSFTDYGLRMLMRMASAPERAFSTTDLAEEFGLSRNHLAKIMQRLAQAGIIETRRGGGGGAILAWPPEKRAVHGGIALGLGLILVFMIGGALYDDAEPGRDRLSRYYDAWLRAADLLYALFFGLTPFPGAGDALINVLTTTRGWGLILVGSLVGGLFAAFAFALSLFSVPMLMSEKRDALTAMGLSFAMTTHNIRPCLAWGVIVAAGMVLSAATGLLALAVVFPVLGHGTWHAWRAIGEPTR